MAGRTEELIMHQMINNQPFFSEFVHFVQPEYFSDATEQLIYELIVEHSEAYNSQPNIQVVSNLLHNRSGVDQSTIDEAHEYVDQILSQPHMPIQSAKWLMETTEDWCQNRALENAIYKSVHVFQGNDDSITREGIPDLIREALTVNKGTDLGHDYMRDQDERWEQLHKKSEKIPFDIEILNRITKGGLEKGTLNCIMAGTGVGKTIFLCHIAANAIRQGKNVVYISAEMGEEKIGERIDANLLDIDLNDLHGMAKDDFLNAWKKNVKLHDLQSKSYGRLLIKQYPTATAHVGHFRSYLDELKMRELFEADMIIVDYLNICVSARIKMGSGVGSYMYIKAIAEELRGLAVEQDVPIFTATQVNRSGMDASDISMGDTSESVGLPHTLDLFLALIAPEELEQVERVIFKQLKNRYNDMNFPARRFLVGLEKAKMRFYHVDDWERANSMSQGKDDEKKKKTGKYKKKNDKLEEDIPLFDQSTNMAFVQDINPNAFAGVEM